MDTDGKRGQSHTATEHVLSSEFRLRAKELPLGRTCTHCGARGS